MVTFCIRRQEQCRITNAERAVLERIASADAAELAGEGLRFLSGKLHPEIFELDDQGKPRSAVTGNEIGDVIYLNTDYFRDLNLEQAAALLIHELGHHHQVTDHAALDRLGLKVIDFAGQYSSNVAYPYPEEKPFRIYTLQSRMDYNRNPYFGAPQIVLDDGSHIHDISAQVIAAIPCPRSAPVPLFFFPTDSYWEESPNKNAARLGAHFDCTESATSAPGMGFIYTQLSTEMRIEFDTIVKNATQTIDPQSIRIQFFRTRWKMDVDMIGDREPLHIVQMARSVYPHPEGGFEQVFRTRVRPDQRATHALGIRQCYGYFAWSNPLSAAGFPEIEIPVDSCEFTMVDDDEVNIELKIHTLSFDKRNPPYFSRVGLRFGKSRAPQEGKTLMNLPFLGSPAPAPEVSVQRAWVSLEPNGADLVSPLLIPLGTDYYLNFAMAGENSELLGIYLSREEMVPNGLTRLRTDEAFPNPAVIDTAPKDTPDDRYPETIIRNGSIVSLPIRFRERALGYANIKQAQFVEAILVTRGLQIIHQPLSHFIHEFSNLPLDSNAILDSVGEDQRP